jgi:CheY-like chemotaxis protein
MAGIDGWSLVEMLRGIPSTARIPIAMMAGVLDTVDPERIREAPIQGFLKKPVELRELGDRILRLMETPVPLPESSIPSLKLDSPFATLPATRLDDLPEFRQKQASSAPAEEDLLELTEADLYPEPLDPVVAAVAPASVEESLDLEELDLDSLRGLSSEPEIPPVPAPVLTSVADHSDPTPQEWAWPVEALDGIATLDGLPAQVGVEEPEPQPLVPFTEVDLPDLGAPTEELMDIASLSNLPELEEVITAEHLDLPLVDFLEEPVEETSFTPPLPPLEESLDWSDESESMLATMAVSAPMDAPQALTLPEEELELLDVAMPEVAPEPNVLQLDLDEASPLLEEQAPIEISMVPESTEAIVESAMLESAAAPVEEPELVLEAVPIVSPGSRELLDALMADPVLMDSLAKAVVARLGDQVLREIAWEVIPELAERLPRS